MEHDKFPVDGFPFMDEPATDEQKDLIVGIAAKKGKPIKRDGQWPKSFSRWDAYNMIKALEELPDATDR